MLSPINNAGIFLIYTLFDIYLFVLVIRLILVKARADYYNPLSQFVIKLTQPIITPLKKFLPNIANIEISTIFVILILEIIKFFLISLMMAGLHSAGGLIILAVADFLKIFINTFFYAILIQAILSWIQPGNSPIAGVLNLITTPIIRPLRRIIPPVGGFDITPIPALIILQLLIILVVTPLFNFGQSLAFGFGSL